MTTRTPDEMVPGKQPGKGEGPKPVRYIEHDGRDDASHRTGEERTGRAPEPEEGGEAEAEERSGEEGGSKAA